MLVSELIEKLSKMPQDWDVTLDANNMLSIPIAVEAREDNNDKSVFILDNEGGKIMMGRPQKRCRSFGGSDYCPDCGRDLCRPQPHIFGPEK